MTEPLAFVCNGDDVVVDVEPGESLLSVFRERLRLTSVKDGCAPQGQCGCCTVLVDGDARVACVTPAARVVGRAVTTVEGLDEATRTRFADAFVASGGSQCGFCTPGIVMRFATKQTRNVDRGLAAHLCRCTGWLTVKDAITGTATGASRTAAAARRAELEGGWPQVVGPTTPLGGAPFADDTASVGALVAVPRPPGSSAAAVEAAGIPWVVAESLLEARAAAGKVQGRRTTMAARPPLLDALPQRPDGGVALATSWVEPAYLEPDASWCAPGGEPASPLANGGAFGGKESSLAPRAARELADHFGRVVRVVYSREDVVRLGPKRPPIAAVAVVRDGAVLIDGVVAARCRTDARVAGADGVDVHTQWRELDIEGPPVSWHLRAAGVAETAMLVSGALGRDIEVVTPSGARASATYGERVHVTLAAGDPLDEVVLRSYAIGAAHMALGWVLRESITVDPGTGEVHDLTIRSFGILHASETPAIDVTIVDDDAPPRARSTDAVFAAVAAATWNALGNPVTLPARGS